MSEELPKRLFKEGEETQVTQINNNCKLANIITKLERWLPKELKQVKKDQVFSQFFKLHDNGLGFSARVIHSLLCRELVTYKKHELWFVFARRPLRFSLQEFHAVTGLECDTRLPSTDFDDWEDDGGFWSKVLKRKECISFNTLWKKHFEAIKKWDNVDRIRFVYLAIIVCVVLARDEKANIPSHGRTKQVWGVDVDRLYFPLFVNGNHWISVCVNITEKKVEVFDCFRGKNRQHVERFAVMIPRIVKAVAPPDMKKHLLLSSYSMVDVPMKSRLNKSCCDCGVYALKHLECHLLGYDIDLVDDEIIMGCRQKIAVDIWEAAQDPILVERMASYEPSEFESSDVFDIIED